MQEGELISPSACLSPSLGMVKWSMGCIFKEEKFGLLVSVSTTVTHWLSSCKQFPICKMDPRVPVCTDTKHG